MYKLHLILKYLRKRRIAWVSLIAVMLCTAMVLVVISVMGGWLVMFRQSFKGLNGDVMVQSDGLQGFPYYEQILERVRKLPDATAATPVLHTFALLKIGDYGPYGVQVIGYKIDQIGKTIESNIDPDTWRDAGGTIGTVTAVGDSMVVTQTHASQAKIAKLLKDLENGGH